LAFRRLLQSGGLNCPAFHDLGNDMQTATLPRPLEFPVVVKARRLSGSRGVVRADTPLAFGQPCNGYAGYRPRPIATPPGSD
jgi:biotin carboxylase